MSTRSSILWDKRGLHVYKEMHDQEIHLELCDGESNSYVNIIITPGMLNILKELIPHAR